MGRSGDWKVSGYRGQIDKPVYVDSVFIYSRMILANPGGSQFTLGQMIVEG